MNDGTSLHEKKLQKDDSLDIGLIADESLSSYNNLPDPIESAEEAIAKLQQAMDLLSEVVEELRAVEEDEVVAK